MNELRYNEIDSHRSSDYGRRSVASDYQASYSYAEGEQGALSPPKSLNHAILFENNAILATENSRFNQFCIPPGLRNVIPTV